MSELIQKNDNRAIIRWKLLTSVSAAALLVSVYAAGETQAADGDADRPLLWIELGGQLERLSDSQEVFSPPFMASVTKAGLLSALDDRKPLGYAVGEEGKITFQPEASDWVFTASARYGRANSAVHLHHQTANAKIPLNILAEPPLITIFPNYPHLKYGSYYPQNRVKFADTAAKQDESHMIVDFQAGKDVGLGMFGKNGTSVVSAGVRFAQFSSKSSITLRALPDLQYPSAPITGTMFTGFPKLSNFRNSLIHFHDYTATLSAERSFRGVGPMFSWNASAPVAGNDEGGEFTFDWGVNAAVLFGRQKARGHHQTADKRYFYNYWHQSTRANGNCRFFQPCAKAGHFFNITNRNNGGEFYITTARPTYQRTNSASFDRMRSVVVPNLGGFAGLSLKWANAKISLGYRADFFFDAIDGGIDTRKSANRGFYGPFASISVGLGD